MRQIFICFLFFYTGVYTYAQSDSLRVNFCVKTACDGSVLSQVPVVFNFHYNGQPTVSFEDTLSQCVQFGPVPTPDSISFQVSKAGHSLNGVNTYDLYVMSQHILAIKWISSPFSLIAGDVNNSNTVTTFDMVESRKLITGEYTEYPNSTSWKFLPGGIVFDNPLNPFAGFTAPAYNLQDSLIDITVLGIKTGDVNCSAGAFFTDPADERSPAWLTCPDKYLSKGQIIDLPIHLRIPEQEIVALQTDLGFDPETVEILGASLDDGQWSIQQPGRLQLLWWNDAQTGPSPETLPAFSLVVKAKKDMYAAEIFHTEPASTRNLAFDREGREYRAVWEAGAGTPGPNQGTLWPNPTTRGATVRGHNPANQALTYTLTDVFGTVRLRTQRSEAEGPYQFDIPADVMPAPGMYHLSIQSNRGLLFSGNLIKTK